MRNGFPDKAEDDAARQADMAKMLNVFIGMVPSPGGLFTDNIKRGFEQVFDANSGVTRIFDSVVDSIGREIDTHSVDAFRDEMIGKFSKSDYMTCTWRHSATTPTPA